EPVEPDWNEAGLNLLDLMEEYSHCDEITAMLESYKTWVINEVWGNKMWLEAQATVTPELVEEITQIQHELDDFFSNISVETIHNDLMSNHPELCEYELLLEAKEAFVLYETYFKFIGMSEHEIIFNLSPEMIYEAFKKIYPDKNVDDLSQKSKELETSIENIRLKANPKIISFEDIGFEPLGSPATPSNLTRIFSRHDGSSNTNILLMEVFGAEAGALAAVVATARRWGSQRQDAYRHYLWNFIGVRDGFPNAMRTYATNHEWSAMIRRRYGISNNPSAQQEIMALALRDKYLVRRSFADWDRIFWRPTGTANAEPMGRDDLMDFYNNARGRADGSVRGANALDSFNNRYSANTVIRDSSIGQVTQSRRNRIHSNRWYRPRG
ncbi:MAG: hypothetical protein FWF76_06835, partial [Oscillospiraceae bacterium]|nr:hypothetical protein [Oscillospiraceae bacterium]